MGVKKYFRREFQKEMFSLEHDNGVDFYVSCWQMNRSPLPLLLLRTLIAIGCVGTWVTSMVLTIPTLGGGLWFIFLTHWGLIFNSVASVLALFVSLAVFFRGPIDATLSLPWYVKAYWAMFNIATPIAFFITIFYWSLLTGAGDEYEYAIDPVLDVFIHGINSVLMLALLLVGRHPTRLMHFYLALIVGIIYILFTVIFHFSGAESPFGTSWIYPMLDWDNPGLAMGVVIGSAIGLIIMQCIVAGFTVIRDKFTQKYRETNTLPISNEARSS